MMKTDNAHGDWECESCGRLNEAGNMNCKQCYRTFPGDNPAHVKFWMVACDNGKSPTVKHPSLNLAKVEAQRLCRKEKVVFYVLECVGVAALVDVKYSEVK